MWFNCGMSRFESIYFGGPSCAGKTTLVNGLRIPEFETGLFIPPRFITRSERLGDDLVENRHVTHAEFKVGVANGLIDPDWDRLMDGGRIEQYGFQTPGAAETGLPVYSANNAFFRSRTESVQRVMARGLGILAVADRKVCSDRMQARSPDMAYPEQIARLDDDGRDILESARHPIVVIDTSRHTPAACQMIAQTIVRDVLSGVLSPDTMSGFE